MRKCNYIDDFFGSTKEFFYFAPDRIIDKWYDCSEIYKKNLRNLFTICQTAMFWLNNKTIIFEPKINSSFP